MAKLPGGASRDDLVCRQRVRTDSIFDQWFVHPDRGALSVTQECEPVGVVFGDTEDRHPKRAACCTADHRGRGSNEVASQHGAIADVRGDAHECTSLCAVRHTPIGGERNVGVGTFDCGDLERGFLRIPNVITVDKRNVFAARLVKCEIASGGHSIVVSRDDELHSPLALFVAAGYRAG